MSSRTYGWRVRVVALLVVTVLPQIPAVARSGDSLGRAGPDHPKVSNLVGDNFRVSGAAATSDDWEPAVAYNSTSNQYLVVWSDERKKVTRGSDIYGQRFAANGTQIGNNFRISDPAATSNEWAPAVAYNPTSNQYLVAWRDDREEGTRGDDIYGQRVKANGNLTGGDFRISGTAATSDERSPMVAHNSATNQYLVVWLDHRDEGTRGWDVYGRRVKASGRLAGGDFRISGPAATDDEWEPAVAYNPTSNQYLVVWEDKRNYATRKWDIYGRRVKAGGNLAGGDFRISGTAATSDDGEPAVAYNPTSNQYLVVWRDYRNSGTRGYDIYGRRIKAGGNPAGGDFRISGTAATSGEWDAAVAYNPTSNQYLVVWKDSRNLVTRGSDIYGRRVKAGGRLAGGDFRISGPAATFGELWPTVACNPAGNQYLVVWQDGRKEGTRGWDIYGQRVAG